MKPKLPFYFKYVVLIVFLVTLSACKNKEPENDYYWESIRVTATAYNSFPSQTSKIHPNITAWGDSLKPGMKIIAVSQDLIPLGLDHNTVVRIKGDTTLYVVKDKMNSKWKRRIDIYMGEDKSSALKWGKKKVTLLYRIKKDSLKIE
ncbi:3D domain-containing protein [Arenibacter latericius]|uniref:3D domain-containing protein n=1 Tax=Arenibacter latericius TaxID=86104 RepID=UPI00040AD7F1|nr:3D domain-containing protein [Arenibacter latericius]MDX1363012.1 3D domain-containing protein [Arenibacter latericius]